MNGVIAAIVEAYGELRVHKGRILLSLIGVAFSVFAMTAVLGAGGMLQAAITQQVDTMGGRDATLEVVRLGDTDATGANPAADEQVAAAADALGITHRARLGSGVIRVQTADGVRGAVLQTADPSLGTIMRLRPLEGRWLQPGDESLLAPPVVISEDLHRALGSPPVGTSPMRLLGPQGAAGTDSVIIGILADDSPEYENLMVYAPFGAERSIPGVTGEQVDVTYYLWVPPEEAEPIREQLIGMLGPEWDVYPSSADFAGTFALFRGVVLGIGMLVLALGGLGLLNIALVSIRYRIREIGIRRSYGATSARIFFGVLMESVVATTLAGAIGVLLAVATMRTPWVTGVFRDAGLVDMPAFPVSAVAVGMVSAIGVGILAGALPALVATRVKVIDAIRS